MNTITNSKVEVEQLISLALLALSSEKYVGDIISLNVRKGTIPEVGIVIGNFEIPRIIYSNYTFSIEEGLIRT